MQKKLYNMANNTSSRQHRSRHSSTKRHHQKATEEITTDALLKFARKHKTFSMFVGLAITALLSLYVFIHLIE